MDGLLRPPLADRGNRDTEWSLTLSTQISTSKRKRHRSTLPSPTPSTAYTAAVEAFPIFSRLHEHGDALPLVFVALVGRGFGQELDPCTLGLSAVCSLWHRVFNSRAVWWNAPRLLPTLGGVNWANLRLASTLRSRGTEGVCYRCVERSTGRELAVRLLCDADSRRSVGANEQHVQSSSSGGVPYFALRALAALPQSSGSKCSDSSCGVKSVDNISSVDSMGTNLHLSTPLTVSLCHGVLVMFYDFCSTTLHDLMHDQGSTKTFQKLGSQAATVRTDYSISTTVASAAAEAEASTTTASDDISIVGRTRKKRVPLPRALTKEILRQALLSLRSLHRRGVMHRNVKPKHLLVHTLPAPQESSKAAGDSAGTSACTSAGTSAGDSAGDSAGTSAGNDAASNIDGVLAAKRQPYVPRSPKDIRVRLADFSLSRFSAAPARASTPNLVSRWYRAPELLLGQDNYGPAVDIWSIGCIFAEMALGRVLFTGRSEIDQLFQIFSLLGTPKSDTWAGFEVLPHANQGAAFPHWPRSRLADLFAASSSSSSPEATMVNNCGRESSSSCGSCSSNSSFGGGESLNSRESLDKDEVADDQALKFGLCPDGIDLLTSLLACNPSQRPTADQALNHPYFTAAAAPNVAADADSDAAGGAQTQCGTAQSPARAAGTQPRDIGLSSGSSHRTSWGGPRSTSEEALDHLAISLRLEEEGSGDRSNEGDNRTAMQDANDREAQWQHPASSRASLPTHLKLPATLLTGFEFALEVVEAFELRIQTAFRACDLLHRWHDADVLAAAAAQAAASTAGVAANAVSASHEPWSQRVALLRSAACVLVASKVEDVQFMAVDDLVTSAGDLFGPRNLILSEEKLLNALAFDIHRPSAPDVLATLVVAVQAPYAANRSCNQDPGHQALVSNALRAVAAVRAAEGSLVPLEAVQLASFVLECGLLRGFIRDFKAVSSSTSTLYLDKASCSNGCSGSGSAGSTRNALPPDLDYGWLTPTLAAAGALAYALAAVAAANSATQQDHVSIGGTRPFRPFDARVAVAAIVTSLCRAVEKNSGDGGNTSTAASVSIPSACRVSKLGLQRAGEVMRLIHCNSTPLGYPSIVERHRLVQERGLASTCLEPREIEIPWPWMTS